MLIICTKTAVTLSLELKPVKNRLINYTSDQEDSVRPSIAVHKSTSDTRKSFHNFHIHWMHTQKSLRAWFIDVRRWMVIKCSCNNPQNSEVSAVWSEMQIVKKSFFLQSHFGGFLARRCAACCAYKTHEMALKKSTKLLCRLDAGYVDFYFIPTHDCSHDKLNLIQRLKLFTTRPRRWLNVWTNDLIRWRLAWN